MMDFGSNELNFRAIMSQRNRDAEAVYRLAEYRRPPRGIRASIATRLAHLAVHLDSETTDRLVGTHQNATGHS